MDNGLTPTPDPTAAAAVQGWIFSVRRSGRTWLRWLMASAIARESGDSGEVDWLSVFQIIPNDHPTQTWKQYDLVPGFLDRDNPPRLVMTHCRFEDFYATDAPVLVLARRPFDQMASNYHHVQAGLFKPPKPGRTRKNWAPDEFALAPGQGLDFYLTAYRGWAAEVACGRAFAVGYEELKSDTTRTLLRIFDVLGVAMSRASARAAVEYCTFSRMAEAERAKHAILPNWDFDPNVRRTREGQVGRGAALFSPKTIRTVNRRLSAEPDSLHQLLRSASNWTLTDSMALEGPES